MGWIEVVLEDATVPQIGSLRAGFGPAGAIRNYLLLLMQPVGVLRELAIVTRLL